MATARLSNDHHTNEAGDHRHPAFPASRLMKDDRAEDGGEDRHRKADRRRFRQRQQQESPEGERHGCKADDAAQDMRAETLCLQGCEAGAGADDAPHKERGTKLSPEQEFSERGAFCFRQLDDQIHRCEQGNRCEAQADCV